tara:strand:+ start:3187 stop:3888 length:702 start_codon:yes stop_codon:yes gene_type:complete
MNSRDDGYATIVVTALMGSLSVIAIALLSLSGAESRRASALSERIALDAAIEGAFHIALADIVNQRSGLSGLQTTLHLEDGQPVGVDIRPVQDQIDINRADMEQIEERLRSFIADPATRDVVIASVRQRRAGTGTPFDRLEDLGAGTGFDRALPCLREQLTVFHNAAPASGRSGEQRIRDGTVVRIRVETQGGTAGRGAKGTVLLTGDRSEPAWIMDWRRYSDFDAEECKDEG